MTGKVNVVPRRTAGIAGLGFATLIVLANAIMVPTGLPTTGADTASVVAYFATHQAVVGLASTLTPAAWALATVFGAGAVATLWRSDRERGEAWSLVGFAGVVLQNGTFAVITALRLSLSSTAGTDNGTTAALWSFHDALFTLNGIFLALALTGLSLSGHRADLIPGWHRTLGLTSAALLATSATLTPLITTDPGPLTLLGLCGWLMWVAWLIAYALPLLRNQHPTTAPPPSHLR